MMLLVPDSNGEDASPLREFNPCHGPKGSPKGGQFCATSTRVGITSATPGQSEGVYGHMREFETNLKALRGVSNVMVRKGEGAWGTQSEPAWIVGYTGNGEARKLLAVVAKRYDQDAVLMMGRCQGPRTACDPAVDLRFDKPVTAKQVKAINLLLSGTGFGGWTWGKVGGRAVLRVVSVPEWGGSTRQHMLGMRTVANELEKRGLKFGYAVRWMKTSVLDKNNYDAVIAGKE